MSLVPGDIFSLPTEAAELDRWLESLVWPVPISEPTDIYLELEAGLQVLIENEPDARLGDMMLVGYPYVSSLASVLYGLLLTQRTGDLGQSLQTSPNSHHLHAVATGQPIPLVRNLPAFVPNGFSLAALSRRIRRRYLRWRREKSVNRRLYAKTVRNRTPGRATAFALPLQTVINSTYTRDKFDNLKLLFPDVLLPLSGLTRDVQIGGDIAERLSRLFLEVGAAHGISIRPEIANNVRSNLRSYFAILSGITNALDKKKQLFKNNELLCAALGEPTNRAIAISARNNGAHVTAYLHGNTVFAQHEFNRMNLDLALCDDYVVYIESSISRLRQLALTRPPIRRRIPRVVSSGTDAFQNLAKEKQHSPRPSSIRRIMILEIGVFGDLVARHKPPDLINVDLTIRVARLLQKHRYEVQLKRHPDALQRGWNHDPYGPFMKVSYTPFEEIMDETDAYLLTYPTSSIFHHAVCSNKPIIYLDDGLYEWFERPRELFERRAKVVKLTTNERNRLMFSEDELLEAVSRPVTDPDMSYAEELLFR